MELSSTHTKPQTVGYIYGLFLTIHLTYDKQRQVLPGGFIPGPNKSKIVDFFLFPGLHHLSALQWEGLCVWNASQARSSYLAFFLPLPPPMALAWCISTVLLDIMTSKGVICIAQLWGNTSQEGLIIILPFSSLSTMSSTGAIIPTYCMLLFLSVLLISTLIIFAI